ncbi:hypothetical protein ATPR_2498 [Acetobacter tropicalis NBRC 101654]|uniref:Uncharacterized protein n=1 Tax=Acetobacter tropicalis NBRC 101654 TaxID=749388 RepID=F7VGJ9_9PROT|nr:hypothetical protein ATPR_2498 [Acetobacter tropicalis NBRC 101654]
MTYSISVSFLPHFTGFGPFCSCLKIFRSKRFKFSLVQNLKFP